MIFNNLQDALSSAKYDESGITFINGDKEENHLSYFDLYSGSCRVLYELQSKGIKPGSELVFQIDDNEDFIRLFWACILGKIVPVPVSVGDNEEHKLKLLKIWRLLDDPFLVTVRNNIKTLESFSNDKGFGAEFEAIKLKTIFLDELENSGSKGKIIQVDANDIAFIQFSSGSTGDPKGVVLTHRNLLTNIYAIIECAQMTTEDKSLSWMPLTHDMGLIGFHITALVARIHQFIMPSLFHRIS